MAAALVAAACSSASPEGAVGGADASIDAAVDRQRPEPDPDPVDASVTGPALLSQTGLYADFAARTVAADLFTYAPRYEFWADGAEKSRWLYLPPGDHHRHLADRPLGLSGGHEGLQGVSLPGQGGRDAAAHEGPRGHGQRRVVGGGVRVEDRRLRRRGHARRCGRSARHHARCPEPGRLQELPRRRQRRADRRERDPAQRPGHQPARGAERGGPPLEGPRPRASTSPALAT